MNILITRPLMDAEDLMEKLFAYGHKIIHLPTLKISTVETELVNPDNFDAFVFTSTNAVRNLQLSSTDKSLHCFCVGFVRGVRNTYFEKRENAINADVNGPSRNHAVIYRTYFGGILANDEKRN